MSFNQKVINLGSIIVVALFLYFINNRASQASEVHNDFITAMQQIGKGEQMDEKMKNKIGKISILELNETNEQSPLCFVKAYNEVVLKNPTNNKFKDLFNLFSREYPEYEKVTNCTHYYSLLLSRVSSLEESAMKIANTELLKMQKAAMEYKYPKNNKDAHICVYVNSYNTQSTIKEQFKALTRQQYSKVDIHVDDDGSTDNSPMFIKFLMENHGKIHFNPEKERRGVLKGFKNFIRKCEDSDIVLVLQGNQHLLGDQALWIIDRIFSNLDVDLAFFSTLTTKHMNLENLKSVNQLGSQINPFIAFRKSLANPLTYESKQFEGLERNYLAIELAKQAKSIKVVEEALMYRFEQKNQTLLSKLSELVPTSYQN